MSPILEEPFHELYRHNVGFWDETYTPQGWLEMNTEPSAAWCVFCCHPKHLESHPDLLPAVTRFVNAAVILYRRDMLASFASMQLAEANWEWSTCVGEPATHGTVTVDRDQFAEWCNWIRDTLDLDKQRWSHVPHVTIAYEDLVGDYVGQLRRAGEVLGIDMSGAVGVTAKKEQRPLSEVVTNYQEARTWAVSLAIS